MYPNALPAPVSDVDARAWYSTGIVTQSGTCWEIRLRDREAEQLAARIDDLRGKLEPLLSQREMLQDQAQIYRSQGRPDAARVTDREADVRQTEIETVQKEMDPLQSELISHGDYFKHEVLSVFGPQLLRDGDQIVNAGMGSALITTLEVTRKPTPEIEKTLLELRRDDAKVIDLRTVQRGKNYCVEASVFLDPGSNEDRLAAQLEESVTRLANRREPGLFPVPPRSILREHRAAAILGLRIVEDPLDEQISPITRVINAILAWFDSAPEPEHRLAATARHLRLSGQTEHVGIEPEREAGNVISVIALLSPQAAQSQVQDVITQRLQGLLGQVSPETVALVRAFYDRVVDSSALQRMTIERPLLDYGNVAIRYDYMSGYIPIFILGLVGLLITFAFGRWEKKGLIRKRGVEEAEAS
jgi:hypothetical protein